MDKEFKIARSLEEITQEYNNACFRLGHVRYQIDALGRDEVILTNHIRDLNLEASAQQKAAKDAAQKAALTEVKQDA